MVSASLAAAALPCHVAVGAGDRFDRMAGKNKKNKNSHAPVCMLHVARPSLLVLSSWFVACTGGTGEDLSSGTRPWKPYSSIGFGAMDVTKLMTHHSQTGGLGPKSKKTFGTRCVNVCGKR
jgi:hypothetical protein